MILITLHNSAYCLQKLENYDECASYLDGCAYNASIRNILAAKDEYLHDIATGKIRKERYQSKLHSQLCAILSQNQKHDAALKHAQEAVKYAQEFIGHCAKACQSYSAKNMRLPNYIRQKRGEISGKLLKQQHDAYIGELVKKNSSIFDYLSAKLSNKSINRAMSAKIPKLDLRSILGVQHHNDWIYSYEMSDVLMIKAITLTEVKTALGLLGELNKDLMLEKICQVIVVCYCLATELRYISKIENNEAKFNESHTWHLKAFEIARDLIPLECPLFEHIKQSYNYYFSKSEKFKETSFTSRSKSPILKEKSLQKIYTRSSSANRSRKIFKKTPVFQITEIKKEQNRFQRPNHYYKEPKTDRAKPKQLSSGEHSKSDNNIKYKKIVNRKHLEVQDFVTGEVLNSPVSRESFDSDYIRKNYVISSQELYGDSIKSSINNSQFSVVQKKSKNLENELE